MQDWATAQSCLRLIATILQSLSARSRHRLLRSLPQWSCRLRVVTQELQNNLSLPFGTVRMGKKTRRVGTIHVNSPVCAKGFILQPPCSSPCQPSRLPPRQAGHSEWRCRQWRLCCRAACRREITPGWWSCR